MERRRVTLGEIEFAYDRRPGVGTPFLFLHGTTASRQTFSDVIGAVPAERPILNFDLRAHGESGWSPTGDYLIEDHVGDIRLMLRAVTGPAVIVGWSLGSLAGILAAGHDPGLVNGILLGDATPYAAETVERYIDVPTRAAVLGLGEIVRQLDEHDFDWGVEQLGELEIAGTRLRELMPEDHRRAYLAEASTMDPDVPRRQLSRPLSYDVDALLRRVTCPVRLARGDVTLGSVVLERDVERLRACCADFEDRYEPRCGHGIHRPPFHQAFRADISALAALVP